MLRNSKANFGLISKVLHWLIALGIIGLTALGWWMVGLSYYDSWYNRGLELHRAVGMTVLCLACFFIAWKFISPSPDLQAELADWEKLAARAAHGLLLVAMLVIPISGYVISTSAGAGFAFFGLFDFPAIVQTSEPTRDLAIEIHYYVAYGLIAVVVAHAGAALKHQFIDKHDTLKRMLWG